MKAILALGLIFISSVSFAKSPTAADYSMAAVEVGFKANTVTVSGSRADTQATGYQLGVSGVYNITEKFGIKSGLFYSERPFSFTPALTPTEINGKITYFEVPAFFMFKFEEYAGVYAGPSLGIKLSDQISTGALTEVKAMVVPITLGVQFKFLPNFGANVFFESVSDSIASGATQSRAVGVNLMFVLD